MSESKSDTQVEYEDLDEDEVYAESDVINDNVTKVEPELLPINNIQDVKFYHVLGQLEKQRIIMEGLNESLNNLFARVAKEVL